MARNKIAKVKLSPGRAGYFDELTNVYLNIRRSEANVYDDMNTANLRFAVANSTIMLVEGSFDIPVSISEQKEVRAKVSAPMVPQVEEPVAEIISESVEEVVIEETNAEVIEKEEETVLETLEEVPVVETSKKKTGKGKKEK